MKKIINYYILIYPEYTSMIIEVKEYIKKGWQPLGGLSLDNNNNLFQAMVKYEE